MGLLQEARNKLKMFIPQRNEGFPTLEQPASLTLKDLAQCPLPIMLIDGGDDGSWSLSPKGLEGDFRMNPNVQLSEPNLEADPEMHRCREYGGNRGCIFHDSRRCILTDSGAISIFARNGQGKDVGQVQDPSTLKRAAIMMARAGNACPMACARAGYIAT